MATGKPTHVLQAQARADTLALLVAKAIRADLFITDRQLLVDCDSDYWRGVTTIRPEAALPIIGLYLRQQEVFLHYRSPSLGMSIAPVHRNESDRVRFYWEAAQLLTPARHRWEFAAKTSRAGSDDTVIFSPPRVLTWRMGQVLQARDRLLTTLAVVPKDHSAVDEVLTELELILLWLMAAFDITAQAAHIALGVPMNMRNAACQYEGWLGKAALRDEGLVNLVRNESDGQHILTIVRALRNSIHGDALSAGGMIPVVGDHAREPLVALPVSSRGQVLDAMDKLGGRDVWGVAQPFPDSDLHLHPGAFIEQLLPRAFSILNELMNATPVSKDVDPERIPQALPRMLRDNRIIWQLGLEQ